MPVLLHVGPHDTGGPAIQAAMRANGEGLSRHGISYFGPARLDAARSATAERTIVSAERLAEADIGPAIELVRDLGGDSVQVVVTLQPLASILPVAWQRFLCNRLTAPYDEWLDAIFNQPDAEPASTFWRSHRHDAVVARWTSVVGAERLTVIATRADDEALSAFARVAELPDGLVAQAAEVTSRLLTVAEADLLRAVNVSFQERNWRPQRYNHTIRDGVVPRMKRRVPAPGEPMMTTPAWAISRANEIAATAAGQIRQLGVHTVGDMTALSDVSAAPATVAEPRTLSLDAASQAIIAAIEAAQRQWERG